MEISILGFGNLGSSIANLWKDKGHKITVGTRNPTSEKALAESEKGIKVVSMKEAIEANEIVLLAFPFNVAKTIIKGNPVLKDRIILDTTNPPISTALEGYETAAQAISSWSGSKRVVKVFNAMGIPNLLEPNYNGLNIEAFICGDDQKAKLVTKDLVEELGFEVLDLGGLPTAVHLENLAKFWNHLAYVRGEGSDFAFKIVRRKV